MENPHPQLDWLADPLVLVPILTLAVVYAMRFRTARAEAGGRGTSPLRALAFAAGLLVLVAATATPLDGLGERYLFSAHMLQHVLLGDVAPLLLLLGLSRVIMRPATRRLQRLERALGPFAHPLTGLLLWLGTMYLWHVPAMYEAALASPLVHLVEHVSFFAAGLAVWWPLIQPVPMRRRLTGMWPVAYIGAAKFGLAALGLYLTWSSGVVYEHYEAAPHIWGLSHQTDQNAGGAIMMVEQSLTFVVALVVVFSLALKQSETEQRRRERLEDAAAA
ncbi:MAG TPA: cytochrome c oxidase assembly protein [Thermoleophilaceae bacterium]|nr:cytochrome c oxidase assembly protein [Thermoleophilaceae bacterium]